jgi:hypothetical protein
MRPIPTLFAVFTTLATVASARAGTIDLVVNAYATYSDTITPIPTKCGDALLTPIEPGSIITYEIAVAVDPAAAHPQGNMGLATIVFSVLDDYGTASGHEMSYITAAESGYWRAWEFSTPFLRYVTDPMWVAAGIPSAEVGYNGGWGFDNSGLPVGGDVTVAPGNVLSAGALAPLTWTADVDYALSGLQPYARLGVGIGTYTFPDADPIVGGWQGGFGQVLDNTGTGGPRRPGDGQWLMFRSTIDTSGWDAGADYGWNVVPTNGAVYSPTVDYNYNQGGGFRIAVYANDMSGDSFAFFLIPEPASAFVFLAAAARFRRRA